MVIEPGIYNIFKPKGPTSHDVVARIKRNTRGEKVGHAGTLDPLASGVLVVAVGREYTKKLREVVEAQKEYVAEIKLGANTDSGDAETSEKKVDVKQEPSVAEINKAVTRFVGSILQDQTPYSAVKVGGIPAHKYVRSNKELKLGQRHVEIMSLEVLDYRWPILKISVTTGPGTYIRVLAADIGKALDTGGYLISLERTAVGQYNIENSIKIE